MRKSIGALALLGVVFAGCTSQPGKATAPSRPVQPSRALVSPYLTLANYSTSTTVPAGERVQSYQSYPVDGVTVAPASGNPSVTQQSAVATAAGQGLTALDGTKVQPTAVFGALSSSVLQTISPSQLPAGLTLPPGDPAATDPTPPGLTYQGTPVWVVTYQGVGDRTNGAPTAGGSVTVGPVSSTTTTTGAPEAPVTVVFVDATSGKYLFALSY